MLQVQLFQVRIMCDFPQEHQAQNITDRGLEYPVPPASERIESYGVCKITNCVDGNKSHL